MVPRDTQVNVWVAVEEIRRVPEKVPVPPVVDMQENHAREDIFGARLQIGHVTRMNHHRPAGIVYQQRPVAGTPVDPGSPVALWVSLGPPPEPKRVQVPNLWRKELQEARELLESRGLTQGRRVLEDSETQPEGTILRQEPGAGEWVNPGRQVNVWVARRPPPPPPPPPPEKTTYVPDLAGKNLDQAKRLLSRSRLHQGAVRWRYSLSAAGAIVGQEPPAGFEVRVGSSVNLWRARPIPPWCWAGGGLLAVMLGYIAYRIIKKPGPEPPPLSLEARAGGLDKEKFEAAWKGGKEASLELRLRARPDLGTQDLEAPGPLVRKERREHE
jgi:beta-lactam-binding protein with PASTA domain